MLIVTIFMENVKIIDRINLSVLNFVISIARNAWKDFLFDVIYIKDKNAG